MSAEFVITKRHTFEPANEVYFAYSLKEAQDRKAALDAETGTEWLVAVALK